MSHTTGHIWNFLTRNWRSKHRIHPVTYYSERLRMRVINPQECRYPYFQKQYQEKNMCLVPHLMNEPLLKALQRYYGALREQRGMILGDAQSELRYISHTDPFANLLHPHFEDLVSNIVGTRVMSSYNYSAIYTEGADLPRHTDRIQCMYTLNVAVNVESFDPYIWPLYVNEESVLLRPGDAVLYAGYELEHFRNPLPPGNAVSNIFFHFVGTDFKGRLN